MINKIHHVSAIAKSAERTTYFYTTILGLRLVKNTVNQDNTQMRHLFFGDYLGSPGSLLTFFEIQKVGHRQDLKSYFSTNYLAIPKGSLDFWQQRFTEFKIEFQLKNQQLVVRDFDDFELTLVEVDEQISEEKATRHTSIPRDAQIIRILGTSLVVEKPTETTEFFKNFLNLSYSNDRFADSVRGDFTLVEESQATRKSRVGRGTIDHVAYSVETFHELEELYHKAQELNLVIEKFLSRGYFSSLYLREPSGLRIEIATEEPGFLIDEELEHLGEHLALPDFLEPQRKEIELKLEEL
ncbi:VOC family protein [Carnobacterium gallinarum]|uniref:VOC family protein n=1 Tax=Carnobacterium gallinarum TaxID=2749 RepID=UPI00054F3500|nr:VOC family protein [Carnobacterium gallinarum]